MATLAYTMMQKLYDAKDRMKKRNLSIPAIILEHLADRTDGFSKTLNDGEQRSFADLLIAYRKHLSFIAKLDAESYECSEEEVEMILGIVNEVTCPSSYASQM